MLEQLLAYLHNWFRVRDSVDGKHPGTYKVENGGIVLPFIQNGQYFRIIGSALGQDGLYIYGESIKDGDGNDADLTDETFDGSVWALAIPKAVIALSKEIAEWQEKYGATVASPFSSESFGGYSYTKPTMADASSGSTAAGWEGAFKSRLNQYRKIRED